MRNNIPTYFVIGVRKPLTVKFFVYHSVITGSLFVNIQEMASLNTNIFIFTSVKHFFGIYTLTDVVLWCGESLNMKGFEIPFHTKSFSNTASSSKVCLVRERLTRLVHPRKHKVN